MAVSEGMTTEQGHLGTCFMNGKWLPGTGDQLGTRTERGLAACKDQDLDRGSQHNRRELWPRQQCQTCPGKAQDTDPGHPRACAHTDTEYRPWSHRDPRTHTHWEPPQHHYCKNSVTVKQKDICLLITPSANPKSKAQGPWTLRSLHPTTAKARVRGCTQKQSSNCLTDSCLGLQLQPHHGNETRTNPHPPSRTQHPALPAQHS